MGNTMSYEKNLLTILMWRSCWLYLGEETTYFPFDKNQLAHTHIYKNQLPPLFGVTAEFPHVKSQVTFLKWIPTCLSLWEVQTDSPDGFNCSLLYNVESGNFTDIKSTTFFVIAPRTKKVISCLGSITLFLHLFYSSNCTKTNFIFIVWILKWTRKQAAVAM